MSILLSQGFLSAKWAEKCSLNKDVVSIQWGNTRKYLAQYWMDPTASVIPGNGWIGHRVALQKDELQTHMTESLHDSVLTQITSRLAALGITEFYSEDSYLRFSFCKWRHMAENACVKRLNWLRSIFFFKFKQVIDVKNTYSFSSTCFVVYKALSYPSSSPVLLITQHKGELWFYAFSLNFPILPTVCPNTLDISLLLTPRDWFILAFFVFPCILLLRLSPLIGMPSSFCPPYFKILSDYQGLTWVFSLPRLSPGLFSRGP